MTFGFHILGDQGTHVSHAVDVATQVSAKYHVILNHPEMASAVMATGATVIYRRWKRDLGGNNGDDSAHLHYEPRHFVRLLDAEAPPGCLLYLGNEPDASDLARLNAWTIAALEECERLGRKGVILNFATGNPERAGWPLLRGAVEKAAAGGHLLGLHEYFDNSVQKDYPHHVGRHEALYALFDRVPEIVITEIAHVEKFDPHTGWRKVGMTLEKYRDELRQALEIYNRHGIHACLFALVPEDTKPWGSFAPTLPLLEEISKLNALPVAQPPVEEPPVVIPNIPKPTTGRIPGRLLQVPQNYVNMRSQPNGAILGQIRPGDALHFYPGSLANGWVYVEKDGGPEGWVSLQGGAVVFEQLAEGPISLLNPCGFPNVITSRFGNRPTPEPGDGDATEFHDGVDYAPPLTYAGPFPVLAPCAGVVTEASFHNIYGNRIIVRSAHGSNTYDVMVAHLDRMDVKRGDQVTLGQEIGIAGSTGRSTGLHVHLQLKANGALVDPLPYVTATLPEPQPEPEPEPEPEEPPKPPGLCSTHMSDDELRQFAQAMTRLAALDEERARVQREVAEMLNRVVERAGALAGV